METSSLQEKKPNAIIATYQLIVGIIRLVLKTFFTI
jgi:hypothetical protein